MQLRGELMPEAAGLEVERVRRVFNPRTANERVALDDLSLELARGDFVAIVGGNGAGKSMLLNAIAGEVSVDSGHIRIDGTDVTDRRTDRRAALAARVFQDPMIGTAGSLTVEENMALALRRGQRNSLKAGITSADRARFRDALRALDLGLEDRLTQTVGLLSGGQRQSLSLTMAVLRRPALLLLDEHTAALDPKTAARVMEATMASVVSLGLTVLMVTHNMADAIRCGNRIVMMRAGRIIFEARDAEKAGLTVEHLVQRFHIADDRMVLA
jgi:putative tryptophan/tyrosine transport system ATP-binding protein